MSSENTNAPETNPAVPALALRPKQAAKALGISERALWTLTKDQSSQLPHAHIGRSVVYPVADLKRWLSEQANSKGGRQ